MDNTHIAKVYAELIRQGYMKIEDVRLELRDKVQDIIEEKKGAEG